MSVYIHKWQTISSQAGQWSNSSTWKWCNNFLLSILICFIISQATNTNLMAPIPVPVFLFFWANKAGCLHWASWVVGTMQTEKWCRTNQSLMIPSCFSTSHSVCIVIGELKRSEYLKVSSVGFDWSMFLVYL